MNKVNNVIEENNKELLPTDHALDAHEFLLKFLAKFYTAKRGGIHDFMEIALFNMLNESIKSIDLYLNSGHKTVNANELMSLFCESCQNILDNIKRNIEKMDKVILQ